MMKQSEDDEKEDDDEGDWDDDMDLVKQQALIAQ
jgi:hypothetical protein